MARIAFRAALVLTLTTFAVLRASKTSVSAATMQALSYWMAFTALLAVIFLVLSAIRAAKDQPNRRLYLRDAMLALVWIIFYVLSIGR